MFIELFKEARRAALASVQRGFAVKKIVFIFVAICAFPVSLQAADSERAAWERQAKNVTIMRDDWGIAHITGKTDADAVFGMLYAQAEDDFNRVETNYLNALGRLAEAEGEAAIYSDLRMKLFITPEDLKAKYQASPLWLKKLMNAFADGLNYYLYKHPAVKPKVITRFEPWMALSFTEGSIGGDIESINLRQLADFYGKAADVRTAILEKPDAGEPGGSNGFAIAPKNTAGGHALLLINPHTSFFFRDEVQVTSGEGLNAYGAVTWGQFFVYQGFNERCGWMHTSSGVDNIDEYSETITKKGNGYFYRYANAERPVAVKKISVPYKTATGMANKEFTVYRTHHGPIVREADGKWISVRLMEEPLKALTQSYSRTKARDYKAFRQTLELHTNSSNNTIYADADGNIAYFHANFIPRRAAQFDWTKPVDGSDPATEWKGVLSLDESPKLFNPANGWLFNTNDSPWAAAGANSPKQGDYPAYVETFPENARGLHAVRVLENKKDFTLDSLIAAAYDSYLTAFAEMIPALLKAWDNAPAGDPLKAKLAEQIALLRAWDLRWSVDSTATSLAVYWGEDVLRRLSDGANFRSGALSEQQLVARAPGEPLLLSLVAASDRLTTDFGSWKTPWGEINRFQRLTGDIVQKFNDAAPSTPVMFTAARWGSLASFAARTYPGTKRMYGTSGNSFVAVVEFGKQVRAKAGTAGGLSDNPASRHFNDQAKRYSTGDLREVYFYREQLNGHIERQYHPGK
ncbi:MAG: acylase [Acidobacteria bacterium]|nr:acylase [Acidobacteriota bacterium]